MLTQSSAMIHTRIPHDIKRSAELVLDKLGISTSEAIRIYFQQITLNNGLPFEVRIPNKVTAKAIKDAKARKGLKTYKNLDELMSKFK